MSSRRHVHDGLAVESENAQASRDGLTGAGALRRANRFRCLCVKSLTTAAQAAMAIGLHIGLVRADHHAWWRGATTRVVQSLPGWRA